MIQFWICRPRRLAALCAIAATLLGIAWMAMAGAPPRYLAVNGAALQHRQLALALQGRVGDVGRGIVNLMFALLLLLTALTGVSAEGATRWVPVGGVLLQPSLILLPVLALRFARTRDALSTLALLIVGLAARLLPAPLRGWGRAMETEAGAIGGALPALGFALGCLGCAVREAARYYGGERMMHFWTGRPRRLAALCAIVATLLGIAWMAMAGAPPPELAGKRGARRLGRLAGGADGEQRGHEELCCPRRRAPRPGTAPGVGSPWIWNHRCSTSWST
jgi:hypothetical protein